MNAALPPNTEESFELEYWGQAYKEGAAWLAANAPAHAVIRVPIHPQSARPYLEGSHRLIGPGAPVDESRPHYVMFITRRALYDAGIHAVERTGSPVYTIQRQKATLLKIYRVAGRRLQSSARTLTSGAHSTRIQPR